MEDVRNIDIFDENINPDSGGVQVSTASVSAKGFGGLDTHIDNEALNILLKAIRHDLVKLGQVILPKYCKLPPCDLHYEISDALVSNDSLVMIIPRNIGKSVYVQGIFPAWNALFMKYEYIVAFSDSEDKAKQQLKMTYDILANNPIISQFVTITKRTNDRIEYINAKGDNVIYKSLGVGQSARGFREEEKRPDMVFIDDVETTEGARSETIRGKIQRWFHNDVLPLGEEGMRIFFIGTMLNSDALITRLVNKPLRVPPMRVLHRSILDENGESRWPEKWSTETLMLMREDAIDHGQVAAFDMERMSRMTSPENMLIGSSSLRYYTNEELKAAGNMKIITVVDLGIKEGYDNDPTIIATAGKDGRGNMWVIDIVAVTNQRPFNIIAQIRANDRLHHPSCTYIEDIGGQEYLVKDIEDGAYGGDYVRIMRISEATQDSAKFMRVSKFTRINRLEIPFKNKKILLPYRCPEIDRLIKEINGLTIEGAKDHDDILDCFIGDTLISTFNGDVKIKDIKAGDMVLTRGGYCRVNKSWCKGSLSVITRFGITATKDHKIFTVNRSWVTLDSLAYSDTILSFDGDRICEKNLCLTVECFIDTLTLSKLVIESIISRIVKIKEPHCYFIGRFINPIMEIFLKATSFTILTVMQTIIALVILSASVMRSIKRSTPKKDLNVASQNVVLNTSKVLGVRQLCGTVLQKVSLGIRKMLKKAYVKISEEESVLSAEKISRLKYLHRSIAARDVVIDITQESEEERRELVYDISVERHHEFFANGILAHNCLAYLDYLLSSGYSSMVTAEDMMGYSQGFL